MRSTKLGTAAIALALAACRGPRVPPPDLSRDPAALLADVRATQARVERVRGTARIRVSSPRASGSVDAYAAAEKPDRVRLETVDFFGNTVAVLAASGGRFAFLDVREKAFYRGEATPENVSRFLPVVVPVEEIATILCGSAPLLDGDALEVVPGDGVLLLTLGRGAWGQRLGVGPAAAVESSRVRRLDPGAGGAAAERAPAYDLAFDGFRQRAGVRFPGEVELDAPEAGSSVALRWKDDLQVNPPADPALFRLEPPPGARVLELRPGQAVPRPGSGQEAPAAGPGS
jgi:hypothetical protein